MQDIVRPNDRRESIREAASYLVSPREAITRPRGRPRQIVDARQPLRMAVEARRELFVGVVDRQFRIAGHTAQEQR
jgi:hypothetical protein